MMRITKGDFNDSRVVDLLRLHHASAHAQTAPGSAHALDIAGLQAADISLWTIWEGDTLLGVGALRRISQEHGEVKSMHTAKAARRRGAARAMLQHIVASAKESGMLRISLETGSWGYFLHARAFYRSIGFVECGAFGDYVPDPNSVYMTLELKEP